MPPRDRMVQYRCKALQSTNRGLRFRAMLGGEGGETGLESGTPRIFGLPLCARSSGRLESTRLGGIPQHF